jgi:hypothetical protein
MAVLHAVAGSVGRARPAALGAGLEGFTAPDWPMLVERPSGIERVFLLTFEAPIASASVGRFALVLRSPRVDEQGQS